MQRRQRYFNIKYRIRGKAMPVACILHTVDKVKSAFVGNWHRLFPYLDIFMADDKLYLFTKKIKPGDHKDRPYESFGPGDFGYPWGLTSQ
jgi:hypothetical protein